MIEVDGEVEWLVEFYCKSTLGLFHAEDIFILHLYIY